MASGSMGVRALRKSASRRPLMSCSALSASPLRIFLHFSHPNGAKPLMCVIFGVHSLESLVLALLVRPALALLLLVVGREGALGVPGAGTQASCFSEASSRLSSCPYSARGARVPVIFSRSHFLAAPSCNMTFRSAASIAAAKTSLSIFLWLLSLWCLCSEELWVESFRAGHLLGLWKSCDQRSQGWPRKICGRTCSLPSFPRLRGPRNTPGQRDRGRGRRRTLKFKEKR